MELETILNAMESAKDDWFWSEDLSKERKDRAYRQYLAFRARILRMDAEKERIIRYIVELEYMNQVVDTQMEDEMIGTGKEYYDKEDWIEGYMYGLKLMTEETNTEEQGGED